MYIPEELEDYEYVVDYGDNYIVLFNRSFVNGDYSSPATIKTLVLYNEPVGQYFFVNQTFYNYRSFYSCNFLETNAIYTFTGGFAFILSVFFISLLLFIISVPTRLIRKGGLFK